MMTDLLAIAGVLTLCLLLLPLSGWWLAARLRGGPLVRFAAACLAGVATLAAVQMCVYVLRLPQWIAFPMLAGICLSSAGDLGYALQGVCLGRYARLGRYGSNFSCRYPTLRCARRSWHRVLGLVRALATLVDLRNSQSGPHEHLDMVHAKPRTALQRSFGFVDVALGITTILGFSDNCHRA